MSDLNVQVAAVKGDILRQAQRARSQVQAEAKRALQRGSRNVEVGHTVAAIGTTQSQVKEVEAWKAKQYSAISKAERDALAKLSIAAKEAERQAASAISTYEGLEPGEQDLLNQGYSVEEINRRRKLASQKEYEAAIAEQEKENLKDNVLVAGNQLVSKELYNSLSSEDKKLLQQVGVNQFNTIKDREYQQSLKEQAAFESQHVKVGKKDPVTGEDLWMERDVWETLSALQRKEVRETGTYTPYLTAADVTTSDAKKAFKDMVASGDIPKGATYSGYKVENGNLQLEYGMPGQEVEIMPPGFIGPIQTSQVRFEDLTKEQQAEYKTNLVYVVSTPEGEKEVPAAEWEAKSEYEQLKVALGRPPSAAEMQGLAGPETPSYGYLNINPESPLSGFLSGFSLGTLTPYPEGTIENIPVLRTILGIPRGFYEQFRLGAEIILPGTQSEVESYFKKTLPEVGRLMQQYKAETYPAETKGENLLQRYIIAQERQTRLVVESLGFPIVRTISPEITMSQVPTEEKIVTGVSTILWTLPFTFKGIGALKGAISKGLVRVPSPILEVRSPFKVGFEFRSPISMEKFTVGELASGKRIWLPKPTLRLPVVRLTTGTGLFTESAPLVSVRSPVSVGWGSGLQRAGLTSTVSKQALAAGSAARELVAATKAVGKLDITSPSYLKLQSRLQTAQQAASIADSKLIQSLGGTRLTLKQLTLLEKVTGLKGLKTSVTGVDSAIKLASKAWSEVETYRPGSTGYIKALQGYDTARIKVASATAKLETVLTPRYTAPPHAGWGSVIEAAEREMQLARTSLSKAELAAKKYGLQRYWDDLEIARTEYQNSIIKLESLRVAMETGVLPPSISKYGITWTSAKKVAGTEPFMGEPGSTSFSPLSPEQRAKAQAIADASTAKYLESQKPKSSTKAATGASVIPEDMQAILRRRGFTERDISRLTTEKAEELVRSIRDIENKVTGLPEGGTLPSSNIEGEVLREYRQMHEARPLESTGLEYDPRYRESIYGRPDIRDVQSFQGKPYRVTTLEVEREVPSQLTLKLTPIYEEGALPLSSSGLPGLAPSINLSSLGIATISLTPRAMVRPSGLAVPLTYSLTNNLVAFSKYELTPSRPLPLTVGAPLTGEEAIEEFELGTKLAPATYTRISNLPGTSLGLSALSDTSILPATLPGVGTTTQQQAREATAVELMEQLRNMSKFQSTTRVATATKAATKLKPVTEVMTKTSLATKFFIPFLTIPGGKSPEREKKRFWPEFEYELEPYPGTYPGLILHFPEPLAAIERLTEPRPIIKKKKIPIRKKGTYPIAGFREVR